MNKKVVWATSFRPLGISAENDVIQQKFLESIQSLNGCDVEMVVSQFGEPGVREFLENGLNSSFHYLEFDPPKGHKYSQTTVLNTGLEKFIETQHADYLVWSTCDFIIPEDFFEKIEAAIKYDEFCCCILPQQNKHDLGTWRKRFMFHFGLDIFVFKLQKSSAEEFKRLNARYLNLGWGCFEHFLSAIPIVLNIKMCNFANQANITKFGNPYLDFSETRQNQIDDWKANQIRLIEWLDRHSLSKKFATGSMYYLLFKNTRLADIGINIVVTLPHLVIKLLTATLVLFFRSMKS